MSDKILEVKGLCTWISTPNGLLKVADDVSFDVLKGEILAVVGESGCGKSSIMYSILGLLEAEPGIVAGKIYFAMNGRKINLLKGLKDVVSFHKMSDGAVAKDVGKWRKIHERNLDEVRGKGLSMMFQDPVTSLNPRRTIGEQLVATIRKNQSLGKREAREKAEQYVQEMEFDDVHRVLESYPNQLADGMNQRAALALALSCEPSLLIVDEPTKNLDFNIKVKIRDLLKKVNREKGVTIIIISHFLPLASGIADKGMVVYAGRIVEYGKAEDVFDRNGAHHPYTVKLLKSFPSLEDLRETKSEGCRLETIQGELPDLAALPPGCSFHPRCNEDIARSEKSECRTQVPEALKVGDGHRVRCWKFLEIRDAVSCFAPERTK